MASLLRTAPGEHDRGQANAKATVLITREEMDQAAQKSQDLRPPA
jgi:hypothetical protein